MKSSLSLSAAALALFGTAACGGQIENEGTPTTNPVATSPIATEPAPVTEPPAHCLAYPACPANETEVDATTAGAHAVSLCDSTIYCAEALAHCEAYPACDAGEIEVPAGTAGSHEVSICDYTISCAPAETTPTEPTEPCPGCGLG